MDPHRLLPSHSLSCPHSPEWCNRMHEAALSLRVQSVTCVPSLPHPNLCVPSPRARVSFAGLLAASGSTRRAADAACFAHPSHRKIMEAVHGMAAEDVGEYYISGIRAPTLCLTAGNDDPRCKPGSRRPFESKRIHAVALIPVLFRASHARRRRRGVDPRGLPRRPKV